MRIEFSTDQAFRNARGNPRRSWSGVVSRRAEGGIFDVFHRAKFALDPDWPVFTMGSCFAREIEASLTRAGVPVLVKGHGVANRYYANFAERADAPPGRHSDDLSPGALNKYAVRAMLHEMRGVLGGETFPDDGLIALPDGTWFDPHSAGLRPLDHATVLANRHRIAASMAEIRNARVVILTLGQTETWLDAETGLAMNQQPGAGWLKRLPERFSFVDYGYRETQEQIVALITLVRERCRPDMRFILTVSPVPMVATFREVDVAVANSATKTMLRTIAETASREFEDVDYFPSYEIVTCSPPARAYEADGAHVTRAAVDVIMARFMASYYPALDEGAPAGAP